MPTDPTPPRIARITHKGQSAWIKRPEAARSSRFTGIHRLIARALPLALAPTNASGGMDALRTEAARLHTFGDAGLPVPAVLAVADDHIVLADAGAQLRRYLSNLHDDAARRRIMATAAQLLARVHRAGLAHGRPFLRDMALRDGAIALLDLEENPAARMPLADAQARDVWLLMMSCAEFCDDPMADLPPLLDAYLVMAPAEVPARLSALARSLRPFRAVMGLTRAHRLGQDARGAYWSIRTLETWATGQS